MATKLVVTELCGPWVLTVVVVVNWVVSDPDLVLGFTVVGTVVPDPWFAAVVFGVVVPDPDFIVVVVAGGSAGPPESLGISEASDDSEAGIGDVSPEAGTKITFLKFQNLEIPTWRSSSSGLGRFRLA